MISFRLPNTSGGNTTFSSELTQRAYRAGTSILASSLNMGVIVDNPLILPYEQNE